MRARSTLDFHSQFRPTPSITAGVAGMESKENDGMSTAIISLSSPSQHLAFCLFVKKCRTDHSEKRPTQHVAVEAYNGFACEHPEQHSASAFGHVASALGIQLPRWTFSAMLERQPVQVAMHHSSLYSRMRTRERKEREECRRQTERGGACWSLPVGNLAVYGMPPSIDCRRMAGKRVCDGW
jgi:hypothetical protein